MSKKETNEVLMSLMEKRTKKLSDEEIKKLWSWINRINSRNNNEIPESEILGELKKEDEVWEYNDIEFLSGTAGYLVVRNGKPIQRFVTSIS